LDVEALALAKMLEKIYRRAFLTKGLQDTLSIITTN
jgi:hypothetical protein